MFGSSGKEEKAGLQERMSIPSDEEPSLPAGWSFDVEATSRTRYYHNSENHATQWSRPGEAVLPAGWFDNVDAVSGKPYYLYSRTRTTQLDRSENAREQEVLRRRLEQPRRPTENDLAAIVEETLLYADHWWSMRDFYQVCERLCREARVQNLSYDSVREYLVSQGRMLAIGPDLEVLDMHVEYIGPAPRGVVVGDAQDIGYGTFGNNNVFYDEVCEHTFTDMIEYVQHIAGYCTDCKMFGNTHRGIKTPCLDMNDVYTHFSLIKKDDYLQPMVTSTNELFFLNHGDLSVQFVQKSEFNAFVEKIKEQWKTWWNVLPCTEVLVMCDYDLFLTDRVRGVSAVLVWSKNYHPFQGAYSRPLAGGSTRDSPLTCVPPPPPGPPPAEARTKALQVKAKKQVEMTSDAWDERAVGHPREDAPEDTSPSLPTRDSPLTCVPPLPPGPPPAEARTKVLQVKAKKQVEMSSDAWDERAVLHPFLRDRLPTSEGVRPLEEVSRRLSYWDNTPHV